MDQKKYTIGVKIGTAALSDAKGLPDKAVLGPIVDQLAELKLAGHKVFLVSSGAVGVGRRLLNWPAGMSLSLRQKQIAAKRGQVELMTFYGKLLVPYGIGVTQSLLERSHFGEGDQAPHEDMAAPFFDELKMPEVLPIINENDGVATHELKCTDNDELLGLNLGLAQADIGIILSNVKGVYSGNPDRGDAAFIPFINFSDTDVWKAIDTTGQSSYGLGGMKGKLKAAHDFLCSCGDERVRPAFLRADCGKSSVFIGSSREPNVIRRILAGDPTAATQCVCRPDEKSSRFCRYWQKANEYKS